MEAKTQDISLLNKLVMISVKRPDARIFYYKGLLMKIMPEEYVLKDMLEGMLHIPKKGAKIWEMKKYEISQLAREYPRLVLKLKFRRADERIRQNFEEFFAEIRKAVGVD